MAETQVNFFTELAQNFDFPNWESSSTEVYVNPRLEVFHREGILDALKKVQIPPSSVVLCSSGTSGPPKVFLFSKSAFLNSARRVVSRYDFSQKDSWICPLPLFHVGALAISARAFLTGSSIYRFELNPWSASSFYLQLCQQKVTATSLIPTQLFDMVQQSFRAPSELRIVFVGGDKLDFDLFQKAKNLGWQVLPTYGMTETASMIAAADEVDWPSQLFKMKLFEGISFQSLDSGNWAVHCDSLFDATLDYGASLEAKPVWISRPLLRELSGIHMLADRIQVLDDTSFLVLGRKDDFIKVRGEFVNLQNFEAKISGQLQVPIWKVKIVVDHDDRPFLELDESLRQLGDFPVETLNMKCGLPAFMKFKKIEYVNFASRTTNQWKRNL